MTEDGARGGKGTVLVVDDDGDIRLTLEMLLQYEGYEVWTAKSGREALERIGKERAEGRRPSVVLSDVKMPAMDGLELLEAIRAGTAPPPVVMISGHADVEMAVEAIQKGASDFIEKPLDQNRVLVSLKNALRTGQLETQNTGLRKQLDARWKLIGTSPPIRQLADQIARVANSDTSVLITGENGSGKEVCARQLHLASPRSAGPFVTVNCAAIPAELIESELFGHEKGSFTGAHDRRIGHFEAAHHGTLFLDEIGDMPLSAQAKVLRALETHEVTRVGGSGSIPVDIRVVAATNADLATAVEDKQFRLDLFYRLNVVPLAMPALRDRPSDIPLLALHFLESQAERIGRAPMTLAPEALERLRAHPFPGNVRELKNVLEAASVFADGDTILVADVEQVLDGGPGLTRRVAALGEDDPFLAPTFEEFKHRSEALFIKRRLEQNGGNVKRTAEELGMQRSHLYKKLDRYELR